MTAPATTRTRVLLFAIIVIGCAAGIGGYVRHVVRRSQAPTPAVAASTAVIASLAPEPGAPPTGEAMSAPASAPSPTPTPKPAPTAKIAPVHDASPAASAPARPAARSFLLFRSTAIDEGYGHVVQAWLDDPEGTRKVAPLRCDRVHYAAGSGVCLTADRGALTVYRAVLFDARFATRRTLALAGPPSRARVSPDGRKAAFTVFISGHGYSTPSFTTRTSIVDALSGDSIVDDLETWPVTRDGAAFKAVDFNFWGVTFSRDGAHFYATLGTHGSTFLVEGDFARRQMQVVAADVECPSLSPDGRRIAFKRRDPIDAAGRFHWHIAVMDLASGAVAVLPGESRSVDDQVEWNGNAELLYAMPLDSQQSSAEMDVWAIAADGKSPARRFARFAFSPAVVR